MMLSEETSAVRPQKQTRFNGAKLVSMLKGSPLTVTGAVIIVLMLLMMIFSPWPPFAAFCGALVWHR